MKTNTAAAMPQHHTFEGGRADNRMRPIDALRRTLMACLLWEKTFYEDGHEVTTRLAQYAADCNVNDVANLAIEAREVMGLRHAPLMLALTCMSRMPRKGYAQLITRVCKRADDMTELVSMSWASKTYRMGYIPMKLRLALPHALRKFNEYRLAKYAARGPVRLCDILALTHPRPLDAAQEALWKRLANNTLATPNTWETRLSAGENKAQAFRALLAEGAMGGLAILRNLNGMRLAGLDYTEIEPQLVKQSSLWGVLPYQFIAAARAVPQWEPMIERAMLQVLETMPKLLGKTALLVDVSMSMKQPLSSKSTLSRVDAAKALAMLVSGVAEDVRVYSFSGELKAVAPRKGFALGDAIGDLRPTGTYMGRAVHGINHDYEYDRIIAITDEQSHDTVPDPREGARGYVMNISIHEPSIAYGRWNSLSGFSSHLLRYVAAMEGQYVQPAVQAMADEDELD